MVVAVVPVVEAVVEAAVAVAEVEAAPATPTQRAVEGEEETEKCDDKAQNRSQGSLQIYNSACLINYMYTSKQRCNVCFDFAEERAEGS